MRKIFQQILGFGVALTVVGGLFVHPMHVQVMEMDMDADMHHDSGSCVEYCLSQTQARHESNRVIVVADVPVVIQMVEQIDVFVDVYFDVGYFFDDRLDNHLNVQKRE